MSPKENAESIEDRSAAETFQCPCHPSMDIELDADRVTLPEALDSTDLEFNQIEVEKTR